jgi:hypothetical protein
VGYQRRGFKNWIIQTVVYALIGSFLANLVRNFIAEEVVGNQGLVIIAVISGVYIAYRIYLDAVDTR